MAPSSLEAARPATAARVAPRRPAGRRPRRRQAGTLAFFLLPFCALFALLYALPIGYAVYQSLFGLVRDSAYGPPRSVFIGLRNYTTVLADREFHTSLWHILLFGLGPVVLLIGFGLALALLVDARTAGRLTNLFRLTAFAPYAVPAVIGTIMWGFLYAPSTSPVVKLFDSIGWHVNPLQSGNVLWAVGNVVVWTYAGYNMMIFLSSLHAVDPALYEAARIDGAGGWAIAWHIKLPILRPAILLSVIFNIIGTLQLFTEPQVLKAISSGITSTWTPNMLTYAQAASNDYSYAAAVSVVLAAAAGILSFGLMRLASRSWR